MSGGERGGAENLPQDDVPPPPYEPPTAASFGPPRHAYSRSDPTPHLAQQLGLQLSMKPLSSREPQLEEAGNSHGSWPSSSRQHGSRSGRVRSHLDLSRVNTPPRHKVSTEVCPECGQKHQAVTPHLYDYRGTVDEELCCEICLQPLVFPVDTPCGHTFCSACLRAHLSHNTTCPSDRRELTWVDCTASSLLVRKLLDKLEVVCPNVDYCEAVMPRADLAAHLSKRCPGAVVACSHAAEGCSFHGPRTALDAHLLDCVVAAKAHTSGPKQVRTMSISSRPEEQLGITVVGGADTPMVTVVVQSVCIGSPVDRAGVLPGDQLLKIGDRDLRGLKHGECVGALRSAEACTEMLVYRVDYHVPQTYSRPEHISTVTIENSMEQPLGLHIVKNKRPPARVSILEVASGGVASRDGRLRAKDELLEVNGENVETASKERVAHLIKAGRDSVNFVIARAASGEMSEVLTWLGLREQSPVNNDDTPWPAQDFSEAAVTVEKGSSEGLGLSVAGGSDFCPDGGVPVFITQLRTDSCVYRTSKIRAGDVILSVDGRPLTGVPHTTAVSYLQQASTANSRLTLVALDAASYRAGSGAELFRPDWTYWLHMPRSVWTVQEVRLRRDASGSLGLALVGGGRQVILVRFLVPGSPAHADKTIRCGDVLLTVNGEEVKHLSQTAAAELIKNAGPVVSFTFVSWPGTAV